MNLQTFVTQLWRVVRLGGTAALAATQASTHVASGDHKALVTAGTVAVVEALYRALVPAAEQAKLYKLYLDFKEYLAQPPVKYVVDEALKNAKVQGGQIFHAKPDV